MVDCHSNGLGGFFLGVMEDARPGEHSLALFWKNVAKVLNLAS